jgi:phosphate-selective porin OprO/OprP
MLVKQGLALGAMVGATLMAVHPAAAQSNAQVSGQIDALQQQIQALQQQLQALKSQVQESQAQIQKSQADLKQVQTQAAAPPPPAASTGPKITLSAKNRPGWESADGQNSIQFTTRLHFDVADYLNYKPGSPSLNGAIRNGDPTQLNSGVNARRARIGILGKFAGDWNYELTYDFGGSTDAFTSTTKPITNGINHAYVTYWGFRPVGIDLGYLDVPHTMDETMSSNDILFMERPSIVNVVNNIAAGDNRSAFGVRGNTDVLWGGVYLTGPQTGANHQNGEQIGGTARATYQVLQSDDYTFHVGLDGQHLFSGPRNGVDGQVLTLSDEPELRVDPTTFIATLTSTSTATGLFVNNASTYGGEVAGSFHSLYVQGEAYGINVAQDINPTANATLHPNLNFWGAYLEGGFVLTGEQRKYDPQTGAYGTVNPAHPLTLTGGGFGAFEVVARYSYIDLNSDVVFGHAAAATGGTYGGTQSIASVGLNWYPNSNVRFMFDYLHANINRDLNTNGTTPIGARIDAIAMRTQVAF